MNRDRVKEFTELANIFGPDAATIVSESPRVPRELPRKISHSEYIKLSSAARGSYYVATKDEFCNPPMYTRMKHGRTVATVINIVKRYSFYDIETDKGTFSTRYLLHIVQPGAKLVVYYRINPKFDHPTLLRETHLFKNDA